MMDMVSLSGPLRGDRALEQLLAPSVIQDPDTELCLNAHVVDSIDVVAATATRMRIERHLREHPQGSVSIWLPQQAAVAARFFDILNPLPGRVHVDAPASQPPAHFTLLPGTPIADMRGRTARRRGRPGCLQEGPDRSSAGWIHHRGNDGARRQRRHPCP